jgi:hypothetical protein
VRIGEVIMGRRRGEDLCGHDEVVPLAEPVELANGVLIGAPLARVVACRTIRATSPS